MKWARSKITGYIILHSVEMQKDIRKNGLQQCDNGVALGPDKQMRVEKLF